MRTTFWRGRWQLPELEFPQEASFVNALQQAGPHQAMDFDRGPDDLAAQLVCLWKFRMHGGPLAFFVFSVPFCSIHKHKPVAVE